MPVDLAEIPGTVEDAIREASRIKSIVTEAVEDGVRSALKTIKQGRHAAEDVIDEAKHTVKRKPFQALGVVFAAGVLVGGFLAWIGSRRR